MKKFIKKVIILFIGGAIMFGIPYWFGWRWLSVSWIPSLFAVIYLDEE